MLPFRHEPAVLCFISSQRQLHTSCEITGDRRGAVNAFALPER